MKIFGKRFRIDPDAAVRHLDAEVASPRRSLVRIVSRPPSGVNFTAFLIRFQKICCSRAGSASSCTRSAPSSTLEREMLLVDVGLANLERVPQKPCASTISRLSCTLPLLIRVRSSKIVDQARFQLDVAPDHLQGRPHVVGDSVVVLEPEQRSQHRRERRAQLVAEHREEAIFREVRALRFRARFLRRLVEAGVIERERGALRQFFGERKLVRPATSAYGVVFTIVIAPSTRSRARSGTAM